MKKRQLTYLEFSAKKAIDASVIFVFGEEDFLKDRVLATLYKMNGASEGLDFGIYYADEIKPREAVEQLDLMPFIAPKKIVVLKNIDIYKSEELKILASYTQNPAETSLLIMTATKPDMRLASYKTISANALGIECPSPRNTNDLSTWVKAEIKNRQMHFDNEALALFTQIVEFNYHTVENELEKLYLTTAGKAVTRDTVLDCVGQSKAKNIFDLQNALGQKDMKKALTALNSMLDNQESVIYIIVMLTRYFTVIWKISALLEKKVGESEIVAKYLPEIPPFFRKDYLAAGKKYPLKQIRKVFGALLKIDSDLKSIQLQEDIAAQMLVMEITTYG